MQKYFIILAFFTFIYSYAQNKHYNLKKGVAIQGYDPVSYFDGLPQQGDKNITTNFNGAQYYFINKENKSRFLKTPSKYEPQYGGWCAFAMGINGEKVKINPETYKIIDGKLYLFYNAFFNNTLDSWNKKEGTYKKKADENWTKTIKS